MNCFACSFYNNYYLHKKCCVQLRTRNFGHHFSVISKNCNVNHSLLSTWHSKVKFWNLLSVHVNRMSIKIVANGKIEVNNVKPILHFLTVYWQWCPKFRVSNCTPWSRNSLTSSSLSCLGRKWPRRQFFSQYVKEWFRGLDIQITKPQSNFVGLYY
jgi:hypothetical protein